MEVDEIYKIKGVNLRIVVSNNKKCLVPDLSSDPNRVNVAIEDNVVVEVLGRG
jgi:hypothetical protein